MADLELVGWNPTTKRVQAIRSGDTAESLGDVKVVSRHDVDGDAHSDIRTKIGNDIGAHDISGIAHEDIRVKIGTDISNHNMAGDAHSDIRDDITTTVANHNASGSAHSDIRNAITSTVDNHNTDANAHSSIRSSIDSKISAHNTDSGTHTDIRNKIGTDIATHDANVNAHPALRDAIIAIIADDVSAANAAAISAGASKVDAENAVIAANGAVSTATAQANAASASASAAAGQAAIVSSGVAQVQSIQAATQAIADQAQAVVVSGDVSLVPIAGQVPLAYSDGRISPNWIAGSLRPTQWLENPTGTTGAILEDDTEFKFTPQMSPEYLEFIPATLTQEIQIHRDGNFGVYVQTDKKLRVNYGGSYTTVAPLAVSDDWVNIQFSYNDNETSAVTFDVNINGLPFGSQQVVTYSDEFIRNIWATDYGFLHIASMGYGFLTNAATTKTQNWGDAIGSLPSVAGAAVTLTQATSTARPLIGRVPQRGVFNTVNNSDRFSLHTTAGLPNLVGLEFVREEFNPATGETLNEYRITSAVSCYFQSGNFTVNSNDKHALSVDVISDQFNFDFGWTVVTPRMPSAYARLVDGVATVLGTSTNKTLYFEDKGNDRYRIGVWCQATSSGSGSDQFYRLVVTNPIVGQTFKVTALQREVGSSTSTINNISAYQRRGANAYDVFEPGAVNGEIAFFDRGDDILAGTIDAITGGEIIIAGRNGVWHDSLTVSAGTWQIGATSYTGGPAGILAVIGDYIFSAVISGRSFTTAERDALYALARERGAPGVFSEGAELVTNGYFSSGDTGWTLQTGWAVTGEQLVNTTGANDSRAYSSVSTTASTTYIFRVSVVSLSGTLQIGVRQNDQAGALLGGQDVTSAGNVARIFTATSGTSVVRFADYFTTCTIDNVSVKAITLTPWS